MYEIVGQNVSNEKSDSNLFYATRIDFHDFSRIIFKRHEGWSGKRPASPDLQCCMHVENSITFNGKLRISFMHFQLL